MKVTAAITDGEKVLVVDLPATGQKLREEISAAGFRKKTNDFRIGTEDEPSVSLMAKDRLGTMMVIFLQGLPLNQANWLLSLADSVEDERRPYLEKWLSEQPMPGTSFADLSAELLRLLKPESKMDEVNAQKESGGQTMTM